MTNSALKFNLLAIFACMTMGIGFPVIKEMYLQMGITPEIGEMYNAQTVVALGIRYFISGIMTLIVAKISGDRICLKTTKNWYESAILGLIGVTAAYGFFSVGLAHTTSIKSSILTQSTIFFSIILAHFYYKDDKLTLRRGSGLATGFTGLIAINISDLSGNFSFNLTGDGLTLLHALMVAVGAMVAKNF